jgi:hypothetical protein
MGEGRGVQDEELEEVVLAKLLSREGVKYVVTNLIDVSSLPLHRQQARM